MTTADSTSTGARALAAAGPLVEVWLADLALAAPPAAGPGAPADKHVGAPGVDPEAIADAGRRFLRRVLGRRLGIPAGEVRLARRAGGKPFVERAPWLELSFSRAGTIAACAIATRPVGIDIALIADMPEWRTIAALFLPPAVGVAVAASPEPARTGIVTAWTRHEAIVKAAGAGLASGARVEAEPRADGWLGRVDGVPFATTTVLLREPAIALSVAVATGRLDGLGSPPVIAFRDLA